jgi:hypothetical protein
MLGLSNRIKKGTGCKEEGKEGYEVQDPTIQTVRNPTKRCVRVVGKR